MASTSQLNDLLKLKIDWVKDEVPPWLLTALDKGILRDLALVSLERSRASLELDMRALDKAMDIIRKAKL